MIHIMFVCHGNICRSPMAEFVLKDMVSKRGLDDLFGIASCATSREEIGNDVHHGTQIKLKKEGISFNRRAAVQMTQSDYEHYDYILCMDSHNLRNLSRIIPHDSASKVSRLLDFSNTPRDIADPWYTGDFDVTYDDIVEGCEALLDHILKDY